MSTDAQAVAVGGDPLVSAGQGGASASPTSSRDVEQRRYAIKLGVWIFLATVTMLFAAFTSSYIVRQAGSDWQPTPLPAVLWFNTLLLVLSGVSLEIARREGNRGRLSVCRASLGTTVLFGLGFLVGQYGAWRDLIAAGFYLPTNPHSSFFYILTGLHAAHLSVGLFLLVYLIGRLTFAGRRGDVDELPFLTGIVATFWHFFGALWIYLFGMLALV